MKKAAIFLLILAVLINPFFLEYIPWSGFIMNHYLHQVVFFCISVFLVFLSVYFLFIEKLIKKTIPSIIEKLQQKTFRIVFIIALSGLYFLINNYLKPLLYEVSFPISNDILLFIFKYFSFALIVIIVLLVPVRASLNKASLHLLFFTSSIIILFVGSELILKSFITANTPVQVTEKKLDFKEYMVPNNLLGDVPKPGAMETLLLLNNKDTICHATYSINKFHCRTVVDSAKANRPKHLCFFGESWIFGAGLNDTSTVPAMVGKNTQDYTCYNMGFLASGPQQALARIESGLLKKEVKEEEGIAIFHFNYSTQIERLYGSTRVLGYTKNFAFHNMNDTLFNKQGTLIGDHPQFYDLLFQFSETNIAKGFKINFPIITDHYLEQSVRFLKKTERSYLKWYPKNTFYILLFPLYPEQKHLLTRREKIKALLSKHHIHVLDYSELFIPDNRYIIPHEGHPNYLANCKIAQAIIQELNLK